MDSGGKAWEWGYSYIIAPAVHKVTQLLSQILIKRWSEGMQFWSQEMQMLQYMHATIIMSYGVAVKNNVHDIV